MQYYNRFVVSEFLPYFRIISVRPSVRPNLSYCTSACLILPSIVRLLSLPSFPSIPLQNFLVPPFSWLTLLALPFPPHTSYPPRRSPYLLKCFPILLQLESPNVVCSLQYFIWDTLGYIYIYIYIYQYIANTKSQYDAGRHCLEFSKITNNYYLLQLQISIARFELSSTEFYWWPLRLSVYIHILQILKSNMAASRHHGFSQIHKTSMQLQLESFILICFLKYLIWYSLRCTLQISKSILLIYWQ